MEKIPEPILYIDDEAENLRGFQFLFRNQYKVFLAQSADEGLEILKNNPIKLIIADQKMPKMTGVDFFEIASDLYPDAIRIILTGYSDIEAIIKAINKGRIFKYVTKPWDKDEFKLIIDNALWSYNISAENRNLIDSLKEANQSLETANKKLEDANQTLEAKVQARTNEILKQKIEIEHQRDLAKQQRDQIAVQNTELEIHRNQLEQLVQERTADLQLAKEKAELSDKLKSAFLANFSHEIRTPMNAIMGFSQLLVSRALSKEEQKEFVELILVNSQHLLNLINEIIDISRIEAGELSAERNICDLYKLFHDIHAQYEEQKVLMRKSHIGLLLNKEIETNKLKITTDSGKLRQVLVNLIENALKFTEAGTIELSYKLDNEGRNIIFFVKDTGIGIDDDAKDLIFERFRKIENSEGKLYRGAGLGLSISKKLIEFLGGKIWVESIVNQGSTFFFSLPYERENEGASPELDTIQQIIANTEGWHNKKILIAEDEVTNYKYVEKLLARTNISLLWAKNGQETFELIKQHPNIDLVLMDIRMPIMDGYEATKRIKEYNSRIPIVAQTAYALEYEKDEILKAGCDDYIAKPYSGNELFTIINKYI